MSVPSARPSYTACSPSGHERTFAELDPDEKHRISHRADAFAKLVAEQFA